MNLKRVFVLFVIFLSLFLTISYATDDISETETNVNIDITKISENFNKSSYVTKLSNIGINVSATQTNDTIVLNYNNTNSIVYDINPDTGLLHTSYTRSNIGDYLNSILVDTIYTMQGNEEGTVLPFVLDDTFCFSSITQVGIEKNYFSGDSGNIETNFSINVYKNLPIPAAEALSKNDFIKDGIIYKQEDFIAKSGNIVFYKTFNENGLLELYFGQPNELNELSYNSMLTALSIILGNNSTSKEKVNAYMKQNYPDFSIGNSEFEGVSVDTSIDTLPANTVDTIMIASNMKYAKFTIDIDKVKEEFPNVVITTPNVGDSTKVSKNKTSNPLVISIIIIAVVVIIILVGVLIKRNQKLD